MKKIVLLLLAVCTLLGAFSSCKEESGRETETTAEKKVISEPSVLDSLPVTDFQGEEFQILAFSGDSLVLYDAEKAVDQVSKVAYDRTEFVNSLLNCSLRMNVTESGNTQTEIEQNHMGGGSDKIGLAMPHPTTGLPATLTNEYAANLLDLSNLTLDGEWYHQSQVKNYQTQGNLYLITSDFTVAGEGISALIYNKGLYSSLGGGLDLYQTVEDGDWTVDTFLTEVRSLGATGASDGGAVGTWALAVNRGGWESGLLYAADIQGVRLNSENKYELNLNQTSVMNKIDTLLEAVYTLSHDIATVYYPEKTYYNKDLPTSDILSYFLGGQTVFQTWDIGSQYSLLRDASFEIGYLPLPKYDTYQEDYRTICAAGYMMIPSVLSIEQQEQSATVIEALSRYSYLHTRPAFFETVIGGRLSEHAEDYSMLVRIHESKYYDIGNAFDGGVMRNILYTVGVVEGKKTCSTYMKQKKAIMQLVVRDINEID